MAFVDFSIVTLLRVGWVGMTIGTIGDCWSVVKSFVEEDTGDITINRHVTSGSIKILVLYWVTAFAGVLSLLHY